MSSRYRRIEELNTAYGLVGDAQHTDFAAVGYPDAAAGRRGAAAGLVPLRLRGLACRAEGAPVHGPARGARRQPRYAPLAEETKAIVRRIVELQKPAHTTFDVKFFWSAFRIGEARLGEDTVVGLGSRDPKFHRALVLGQEHIGETSLAGGLAPVPDRVGRDPLNR